MAGRILLLGLVLTALSCAELAEARSWAGLGRRLLALTPYGGTTIPGPNGDQVNVFPGTIARGSQETTAKTLLQSATITDRWNGRPRCLAVYLDAPSWMHYNVSVNVVPSVIPFFERNVTGDPSIPAAQRLEQCVQRVVQWRTVVVGVDYVPKDLRLAVGFTDLFLKSNFTAEAAYELDPVGLEDDEGDYTDGSFVTPRPQEDVDAINNATARCVILTETNPDLINANVFERRAFLRQCLNSITLNVPSPPPPPPAAPRGQKGSAKKFAVQTRKDNGLAPLARKPNHVAGTYPYKYVDEGNSNTTSTFRLKHSAYVMPDGVCPPAFADSGFPSQNLSAGPREFDSCYYTQTIVYLSYDGSCFDGTADSGFDLAIEVKAQYSEYHYCDDGLLAVMEMYMTLVVWAIGAPIVVWIAFLSLPTIMRMISYSTWPLRLWFLSSGRTQAKILMKMRMMMDAPTRWGWLLALQASACFAPLLAFRKRLLYAILHLGVPDGRNRTLLVMIVSACTISVTVMVWRPYIRIVLDRNPTIVTLQLDDVPGVYGALARYGKILAASLYLGCLSYMALLTSVNRPGYEDVRRRQAAIDRAKGRTGTAALSDTMPAKALVEGSRAYSSMRVPSGKRISSKHVTPLIAGGEPLTPWQIQKAVSFVCAGVLLIILALQAVNIWFTLHITEDRAAFTWITCLQFAHILGIAILLPLDAIVAERGMWRDYFDEAGNLRAEMQPSFVSALRQKGPKRSGAASGSSGNQTAGRGADGAPPLKSAMKPPRDGRRDLSQPAPASRLGPLRASNAEGGDGGGEQVRSSDGAGAAGRRQSSEAPAGRHRRHGSRGNGTADEKPPSDLDAPLEWVPLPAPAARRGPGPVAEGLERGGAQDGAGKHGWSAENVKMPRLSGGAGAVIPPPDQLEALNMTTDSSLGEVQYKRGRRGLSPKGIAAGASDKAAGGTQAGKGGKGRPSRRKNWLLHMFVEDPLQNQSTGDRKEDRRLRRLRAEAEVELTLLQQLRAIWLDKFGEECETFKWQGRWITAKTFKFPAWFLASWVTAFHMLIFHFLKSLLFAERLAFCFVTPTECDVPLVKNLAETYSFEQLGALKTMTSQAMDGLKNLKSMELVVNNLLQTANMDTTIDGMLASLDSLNYFLTPGNSRYAKTLAAFGQRMNKFSTAGFSIGLVLGIITLIAALKSFKQTCKRHRMVALARRILGDGAAGSTAEPDVTMTIGAQPLLKNAGNLALLRAVNTTTNLNATTTMLLSPGRGPKRPHLHRGRGGGGGGGGGGGTEWAHPESRFAGDAEAEVSISPTSPHASVARPRRGKRGGSVTPERRSRSPSPFAAGGGREKTHTTVDVGSKGSRSDADSSSSSSSSDDEKVNEPEMFSVTTLAAFRAFNVPIGNVAFFLGVLLSATVVQLYTVGIILSAILAVLINPGFWTGFMKDYWPYLFIAILVLVVNQLLLIGLVGNWYTSNGYQIKRPAGWFAFMIIASITNLVIGLILALIRLVTLILFSIFTVGLLDRSLLVVMVGLDRSYASFLAGINLQLSAGTDPRSYIPGAHWRAVKRWRAVVHAVRKLGPEGFRQLEARREHQEALRARLARASGTPPSSSAPVFPDVQRFSAGLPTSTPPSQVQLLPQVTPSMAPMSSTPPKHAPPSAAPAAPPVVWPARQPESRAPAGPPRMSLPGGGNSPQPGPGVRPPPLQLPQQGEPNQGRRQAQVLPGQAMQAQPLPQALPQRPAPSQSASSRFPQVYPPGQAAQPAAGRQLYPPVHPPRDGPRGTDPPHHRF